MAIVFKFNTYLDSEQFDHDLVASSVYFANCLSLQSTTNWVI